jgi:hypothetical protein
MICSHILNFLRSVGFEVLTAVVMKKSIFWDITPCSPLQMKWCFRGTCCLHLQDQRISRLFLSPALTLVSCSTYFSNLKMEATCSSETSVDSQRTTWRYIPENGTLQTYCCENLKSYV